MNLIVIEVKGFRVRLLSAGVQNEPEIVAVDLAPFFGLQPQSMSDYLLRRNIPNRRVQIPGGLKHGRYALLKLEDVCSLLENKGTELCIELITELRQPERDRPVINPNNTTEKHQKNLNDTLVLKNPFDEFDYASEIEIQWDGKAELTRRAVARLYGVDNASVLYILDSIAISETTQKGGGNNLSEPLQKYAGQKFEGGGNIPDNLVSALGFHFAFYAKQKSEKAAKVVMFFAAKTLREWCWEVKGWKPPAPPAPPEKPLQVLESMELRERRLKLIENMIRLQKEIGTLDDRDRLHYSDQIRDINKESVVDDGKPKEIVVSNRVVELGYRYPGLSVLSRIGRALAPRYRLIYQKEPNERCQHVDGAVRSVKSF